MDQIHPDVALEEILRRLVAGGLNYWLCYAGVTYDLDLILTDLNTSAAGPVNVAAADFTLLGVSGRRGTITALPIVLTNTFGGGPVTFTGYFVTNAANDQLIAAAAFDTPLVLASGETTMVTPLFGNKSLFST